MLDKYVVANVFFELKSMGKCADAKMMVAILKYENRKFKLKNSLKLTF